KERQVASLAANAQVKAAQAPILVIEFGRGPSSAWDRAEAAQIALGIFSIPETSARRLVFLKDGKVIADIHRPEGEASHPAQDPRPGPGLEMGRTASEPADGAVTAVEDPGPPGRTPDGDGHPGDGDAAARDASAAPSPAGSSQGPPLPPGQSGGGAASGAASSAASSPPPVLTA